MIGKMALSALLAASVLMTATPEVRARSEGVIAVRR